MRAYIITLFGEDYSVRSARTCIQSAHISNDDIHIEMVKATTPGEVINERYTYPLAGYNAFHEGMELVGYKAENFRKIVACSMSHLKLWDLCVKKDEPIMILEHDSIFSRKFKINKILNNIEDGDIVMVNDPRGATRRGQMYHQNILAHDFGVHPIDGVNLPEETNPDGLAGNSAYIITPKAAKKAADLQRDIGFWPNDALLCKQFFGTNLKSYYPYITRVMQTKSTTTG